MPDIRTPHEAAQEIACGNAIYDECGVIEGHWHLGVNPHQSQPCKVDKEVVDALAALIAGRDAQIRAKAWDEGGCYAESRGTYEPEDNPYRAKETPDE